MSRAGEGGEGNTVKVVRLVAAAQGSREAASKMCTRPGPASRRGPREFAVMDASFLHITWRLHTNDGQEGHTVWDV